MGETLQVYESGKGLSVDAGLYPGAVREVEEVSGQYGDQWRFTFSLDEYPDEEPWAWATASLGTKTKLFRWAGILLGRPLAVGEEVARSDLVGRRCQILIVDKADADGQTIRKVDDIMKEKTAAPTLPPVEGTVRIATVQDTLPENNPAPEGQINLVRNRLNDVPQDVAFALCEKYQVEVALDEDDRIYITDATQLTGGAKGAAEKMVAELNQAKKAAKLTAE